MSENYSGFSDANASTSRRVRASPTQDTYDYTYDATDNMTQEQFTTVSGGSTGNRTGNFVWDAFGRLRKVTTPAFDPETEESYDKTIAEYRYNGLGFRIMWQYDADGTVESTERYLFMYDDRWRMVGSFRADDSTTLGAKEAFVSHAAGLAGRGGSTYIDSVILRDRDNSGGWNNAVPTSNAAVSADLNFDGTIDTSPSGERSSDMRC